MIAQPILLHGKQMMTLPIYLMFTSLKFTLLCSIVTNRWIITMTKVRLPPLSQQREFVTRVSLNCLVIRLEFGGLKEVSIDKTVK